MVRLFEILTKRKPSFFCLVLPKLASDKCLQDETICKLIDQNAICSRDANQCLCGPSYYQWENKCGRNSS